MTFNLHTIFDDCNPDAQLIVADADNQALNGAGVDMTGYEGVVFFAYAKKGEAKTYKLKLQQDSAANYGSAADLAGTEISFATTVGADGFAFSDLQHPTKQYVRPVLTVPDVITPNSVAIIALRYGKVLTPVTNADGEYHNAPAEGEA